MRLTTPVCEKFACDGFFDNSWKNIKKNHLGAALNFLTQFEEDEKDLFQPIITENESRINILEARKKISEHDLEEKEKEATRKFKNERSIRQVMLATFWDCCGLVYPKFGPDAHKEKQNVTQKTYA